METLTTVKGTVDFLSSQKIIGYHSKRCPITHKYHPTKTTKPNHERPQKKRESFPFSFLSLSSGNRFQS